MKSDWFYGLAFTGIAIALLYSATRGGYWLLLIWPAVSFAIVGISYLFATVKLFAKRRDGSRNFIATILLAPYLIYVWLVWTIQIFLSSEPAYHRVGENLIVARRLRTYEFPENIEIVCDLTSELTDAKKLCLQDGYICFPILDANCLPPTELISIVHSLSLKDSGQLLIHCANGHGRTGMVAAAWLIANGYANNVDDALKMLKSVRPEIGLRTCQRQALEAAVDQLK